MRSRYTAYVMRDVDYLVRTHKPADGSAVDAAGIAAWAAQPQWLGLEVLVTEAGGLMDPRGTVRFRARYSVDGQAHAIEELGSIFSTWPDLDSAGSSLVVILAGRAGIVAGEPLAR